MTKSIYDILNKLSKVKPLQRGEFQACCPAHKDVKPSLSIKEEGDKILLNCHAGCKPEDIVKAIGLEMADLFIKLDELPIPKITPKIVATYDYEDENHKKIYQVVRYEPKEFRQRHRNGNDEWVWNMEGVRRVLYRLPEIMTCFDEPIYHVEGEKDADNLMGWGKVATTSPGGANAWKPEYANAYAGKKVVVIPDKDTAGYSYAKDVIRSTMPLAREVKVIILPDSYKDISDWLDRGNDILLLPGMEKDITVVLDSEKPVYKKIDDAIMWQKQLEDRTLSFSAERVREERTGIHAKVSILYDFSLLSWSNFNIERSEERSKLADNAHKLLPEKITTNYKSPDIKKDMNAFCAGLWDFQLSTFIPELMDGDTSNTPISFMLNPYVVESGGTILYAPPGRGKSYTALLWAVSIDAGCCNFWPVKKRRVLFINLERSRDSLRRRLAMVNKALGLKPERPLLTLNARGKSLNDVMPVCRKYIKQYGVDLAVLDSISRAGFGDLNENQPVNRIIDALSALCPSWVALAHTSRANEEHAYGSIMLDAGADICVQLVTEIKEDGTLGLGYQITKQNDVGNHDLLVYALTFDGIGLCGVRKAKPYEFLTIEGKSKKDTLTTIMDYVMGLDSGDATATQVETALGFNRSMVTKIFIKSGKFQQTRKDGRNVYYGVIG